MKLRYKTFSKEKSSDKEYTKGAAMLAGGGAGVFAGDKLGLKVSKMYGKKLHNSGVTAKDAKEVEKKLLKKAKEQGIKVVKDPSFNNSAYMGSPMGKYHRKGIAALAKQIKKHGGSDSAKEFIAGVKRGARLQNKTRTDTLYNNAGKDAIVMGKVNGTDVLSHELGHAQYMRSGRSKSVLGKAGHKLTGISKALASKPGMALSVAHGFKAGVDNERNKQEGKKSSAWDKAKSVAVPAALAAPLLIAEGKASLNGLKTMKKLGASKELLKQSKKRLGSAWGTYASDVSRPIIAGGAGDIAGRGYAKLTKKNKKEED